MHKLSYFLPVNRWEMGEGFGKNWKDVWGQECRISLHKIGRSLKRSGNYGIYIPQLAGASYVGEDWKRWRFKNEDETGSNLTKTDAMKVFQLCLLKDVGRKDLQENEKHSMLLNLMQRLKPVYI